MEAIRVRRDWLGWVGWTGALFPTVAGDQAEVRHLEDLSRRLADAIRQAGTAGANASATTTPANSAELFVGCYATDDGRIHIRSRDGWYVTDGKRLWREDAVKLTDVGPAPAELTAVLRSVLEKLRKEVTADVASDNNDLTQIASDRVQLERDLGEYQSIYDVNYHDASYEVDYGTETIGVWDAISRTQRDLDENQRDRNETQIDHDKSAADLTRIDAALQNFGKPS
jgi:hypothetical protein